MIVVGVRVALILLYSHARNRRGTQRASLYTAAVEALCARSLAIPHGLVMNTFNVHRVHITFNVQCATMHRMPASLSAAVDRDVVEPVLAGVVA